MFGVDAAGVVDGDEVVGGGEEVEASLGSGQGVKRGSDGVDEARDELGGYGFAGGCGADEVEDRVVVEGGVAGGLEGGEEPGLESGEVGIVEMEEGLELRERGLRVFGLDWVGEGLLDGVVDEAVGGGGRGPVVLGDGDVAGLAGVEGEDDGGWFGVGSQARRM